MKSILLLAVALMFSFGISAQTIVFSDNFESGTSSWTLLGSWGLSTASSHSTSHSLSESPTGNYAASLNYITATTSSGVNLTTALSANISFYAKYNIEAGFDYMYLDVSANGGTTWNTIATYDGVVTAWTQYTYSLGGYVGNSNVKIRFRFYSDTGVEYDGMYIDDIVITSYTVDNAPPLVLHTAPVFYQGVLGANNTTADIIDVSGVATAELKYRLDGGSFNTINSNSVSGNTFQFTIPQQAAGTLVEYYFHAIDSATTPNTVNTDTFTYLAGNYIVYDNGVVDFVDSTGTSGGAAVRISLPTGNHHITSVLIRNYTDVNRPNDSMLVHIWTSSGGFPGTDICTPKMVYPTATLQNTSAMTLVDFRSDSAALDSLTGDIFIGFTVPSGGTWATITQPGLGVRSFKLSSTGWAASSGTSGASDFHFRAVTQPAYVAPPSTPTAGFTFDTTYTPSVSFSDASSGTVSSYLWDFGDGSSATTQNTNHTYASNNNYQVCLKVTNVTGSDSICQSLNITSIIPPTANFSFDISADPTVQFSDLSTNSPTQWVWDFDHNSSTSNMKNPIYTYPAVGGTYHVCLTATNLHGSSTANCQDVVLSVIGIDPAFVSEDIKIYPNPMIDNARIEMNSFNSSDVQLNVFDVQGKQISVEYVVFTDYIEILRSSMETGQYFIEVIIDNKKAYKARLIVQ